MFITRVTFLFALLCCEVLCGSTQKSGDDFESAAVGGLPAGWAAAQTGTGDGSVWEIQVDESSPAGKHVLAQTSNTAPSAMFNLCVKTESDALDVDLQVSLKAVSGKTDQGGGPVWRYQDANNYYIARFNPLEDNFRVYKVVDGKRTQLATAKVDGADEIWHSIQIEHRGEQIRCSLDGKLLLEAKDDAILESGKIGLWTKADAVTAFTEPILAKPSATDAPTKKSRTAASSQSAAISATAVCNLLKSPAKAK